MDDQTANAIRADFEEWSGGFAPESDHQITVYIDYAAPFDMDDEEVRRLLRAWMCEDENQAKSPSTSR
jgi:hypothetical protein